MAILAWLYGTEQMLLNEASALHYLVATIRLTISMNTQNLLLLIVKTTQAVDQVYITEKIN